MMNHFPRLCLLPAVAVLSAILTVEAAEPAAKSAPRLLPGVQPGGRIQLPNQWSLKPAGVHLEVGDFPVQMALHPAGQYAAVLHSGFGAHEIVVLDLQDWSRVSSAVVPQSFYGLAFDPAGKRLFASGGEYEVVHEYKFADGFLSEHKEIRIVPEKETFIPAGLTVSADGSELYVCGAWGHGIAVISLDGTSKPRRISTGADTHPYACLPTKDGRLYVSLWGGKAVAVVDLKKGEVAAKWATESHPTEMAASPDGKTLYIACSNSTRV
ncbi:MAG: YncE family protein, partial [Planctomycetia bacterium]